MEVGLGSRREEDLARLVRVAVGKGEGKRSGSVDDGSGGHVLISVIRAHELVVGGRPRNHAAQMGEH